MSFHYYKNYADLTVLGSAMFASKSGPGATLDANNLANGSGTYLCNTSSTNVPTTGLWWIIDHQILSTATGAVTCIQRAYTLTSPLKSYYRTYHNSMWESWTQV